MDKRKIEELNVLARKSGIVSFHVAKLLKQRNLDFCCECAYTIEHERDEEDNWIPTKNYSLCDMFYGESNLDEFSSFYLAPPLTMVLEKFWKSTKIIVSISPEGIKIFQDKALMSSFKINDQSLGSYWDCMMYALERLLMNKEIKVLTYEK